MQDLKVTASGYDFRPAHAAMQRYVDGNLLSGVSSAVLVGRDLVDVNCVGWADKEAQIPLRQDHIFRVFSNTKLITSCAALLLFEEGRFGLDDPIERFIPQLANRKVLTARRGLTGRYRASQGVDHHSPPAEPHLGSELRLLRSRHGDLQCLQGTWGAQPCNDPGRHGGCAGRSAARLSAGDLMGVLDRH